MSWKAAGNPGVAGDRPHRASFWRRVAGALAAGLCLAFVGLAAGYVIYAGNIPDTAPVPTERADAIVVLTGDAWRIPEAVGLLASGKADRLFISGVSHATTLKEIAELTPRFRKLFDCCIEVGRVARNTAGNAAEIRDWAQAKKIGRSVIVVTSNYHMPRALAELRWALPALEFVPYPVMSEGQRWRNWWESGPGLRLIGLEYVKYLMAMVRTHLLQRPALPPAAQAQTG